MSLSTDELNLIDMRPQKLEVKDAYIWKKKDMSKVQDFKKIEVISDWTYSTPYKGGVYYLADAKSRVKKETGLELGSNEEKSSIRMDKESEEAIPFERLGRDNPILHFGEVYLFEDDLGDQGYSFSSVRFRVMADCLYVLLRYYLRLDQVLVRIMDTRIFHSFGSNTVIREF